MLRLLNGGKTFGVGHRGNLRSRQVRRRQFDERLSLTPALSRWERENRPPPFSTGWINFRALSAALEATALRQAGCPPLRRFMVRESGGQLNPNRNSSRCCAGN